MIEYGKSIILFDDAFWLRYFAAAAMQAMVNKEIAYDSAEVVQVAETLLKAIRKHEGKGE